MAMSRVFRARRTTLRVRAQSQTQWKEAVITHKAPAAKKGSVQALKLRVEPSWCEAYRAAGQYVQARATGEGNPIAYLAVASPPSLSKSTSAFELLVKGGGEAADAILEGNGVIEVTDPLGKGFRLEMLEPEDVEEVILFCTGTGLAPIRSLVEEQGPTGLHPEQKRRVQLWYGVQSEKHLPYEELLLGSWAKDLGVDVNLVYSQQGDQEYVQQAFRKAKGLENPAKACAVIVGQKDMTMDIKSMLAEQGLSDDRMLSNF
uniref:Oxidoreductase FAD/NAD(P)-binding domain-containing protein n=1 Tax=Picocystis salinarum TaxID=88271 RepID=A0A7S3UG52_9CHLO